MKKRGFTLIELLVALACSTIVLLLLSTSIFFIIKVNNTVIDDSSTTYKILQLKDYILNNGDIEEYIYDEQSKSLIVKKGEEEITLFKNVKTIKVDFYNDENGLKCCSIAYTTSNDKVNELDFVLK